VRHPAVVPNQPATPAKTFRPHPELWAFVERIARDDGVTYTDVLNEALRLLVRQRFPYERLPPSARGDSD
jgi:hypothetical protein